MNEQRLWNALNSYKSLRFDMLYIYKMLINSRNTDYKLDSITCKPTRTDNMNYAAKMAKVHSEN